MPNYLDLNVAVPDVRDEEAGAGDHRQVPHHPPQLCPSPQE